MRNPDARVTYCIQAVDGGPIKIGVTTRGNVHQRLASLQTGNPTLLVVRRVEAGDWERAWHDQLREHRLHGEWFAPHPDVCKVACCRADVETHDAAVRAAFEAGYIAAQAEAQAHASEVLHLAQSQLDRLVAEQSQPLDHDEVKLSARDAWTGYSRALTQASAHDPAHDKERAA